MKSFVSQHRIQILTILSIFAYAYFMLSILSAEWEDARIGYAEGYAAASGTSQDSPETYYLTLKAQKDIFNFPVKVMNRHNDEMISYRPFKIKAQLPDIEIKSKTIKAQEIVTTIVVFAIFIILIYMPFLIAKLLKTLRSGNFFHDENVSNFKRIGQLLIAAFVMIFISDLMYYNTLTSLFKFEDYTIVKDLPNFIWLICGLLFLIFGEMLKNGLALKQEHDLTV